MAGAFYLLALGVVDDKQGGFPRERRLRCITNSAVTGVRIGEKAEAQLQRSPSGVFVSVGWVVGVVG